MSTTKDSKVVPHPTSYLASEDRLRDRENLARQMRTTQMMREQAREQISATQLIADLEDIDTQLQGETDEGGRAIPMEREIISALKARADIKFRLLDKVLPSLKSTESTNLNVHDHNHVHTKVNSVELATRFRMWQQQQEAKTIEGKVAETQPSTPDEEYDFL